MQPVKKTFVALWDLAESFAVGIVLVAVGSLFFIKPSVRKTSLLIRYLMPKGMLALYWKSRLALCFGNDQLATIGFKQILDALEKILDQHPAEEQTGVVHLLAYLYQELMATYMRLGRLDDATSVVLRSYAHTGVEVLPHFPELNVQSSHIVKAGLAAGRLLDEGGFKDIFQSGKPIIIRASQADFPSSPKTSEKAKDTKTRKPLRDAKILPFRRPTPDYQPT
jgi:hypothetical protein